jgi:hypothetical protein
MKGAGAFLLQPHGSPLDKLGVRLTMRLAGLGATRRGVLGIDYGPLPV